MTFLTTKDLQGLVRVDKSTIYRMAEDGRIPAVKVGRQWRFPAEAVAAWLGGDRAVGVDGRATPRLTEAVEPEMARAVVEFAADVLGVMVVLTDMEGGPLTAVVNPCGLFAALAGEPGVRARCVDSWARYGSAPELVPHLRRSDFGFLCARAFVRSGSQLLGMVIAGGIARDDWPPEPSEIQAIADTLGVGAEPIAEHIHEVYRLEPEARERILVMLPRLAVLISKLVEGRPWRTETLAAIADLAEPRSKP